MRHQAIMDFVEIDGSHGEGGGQILRTSVSLSSITGVPVRITRIRSNRNNPGLRPQHLKAVSSAAQISNSILSRAEIGSSEIEFVPGNPPGRFSKRIDVGTAGSVTLIAQTLIPIGIFRNLDLDLEIVGGTEVPSSPTIDYLQNVVLPIYRMIGGDVDVELERRGYYPRGGGIVRLRVRKTKNELRPLKLLPKVKEDDGANILAASCMLPDNVTRREADSAIKVLKENGVPQGKCVTNSNGKALSPGTSILIYRQSEHEFIGASALGEIGKKAEVVGAEAARRFLEERVYNPSTDSHVSDMIVTLASCIEGTTSFTTSKLTSHLETNLQVARMITGMTFSVQKLDNNLYKVELSGATQSIR